jgi:translation initiation factor 4G
MSRHSAQGKKNDKRRNGGGGKRKTRKINYVTTKIELGGKAENAFKTTREQRGPLEEAVGILNKLSLERFDKLTKEILVLEAKCTTAEEKEKFVKGLFLKAIDEQFFCGMYAELAKRMIHQQNAENGKQFKRSLLKMCQLEFTKDRTEEDARLEEFAKRRKEASDKADAEGTIATNPFTIEEEKEEARHLRSRRHRLGNIKFLGELFKLNEVPPQIILTECLDPFIGANPTNPNPTEDELECICKLLDTAGGELDKKLKQKGAPAQFKGNMDVYMKSLKRMSGMKQQYSSKIRFGLLDIIELRERKW